MPFHEKSAWLMALVLLVSSLFYFGAIVYMSPEGGIAPPTLPVLIVYTIFLVVLTVLGQIILAITSIKDASKRIDERERRIFEKAGAISSSILASGTVLALFLFLLTYNGSLLFYTVFGSLIVAQLAEYFLQIYFYHRVLS
ncbi:hypothetical protein [Idiomarina sp. HP20-50]|uniref:hypothetical protein n=1 Tax=Idiomarina sp. HP20-50 TaxID=3070813 RepID=UPI00294ABFAD|nr:hypothetical protein [Idiomarina sp. HP20-50]MDV6315310.1 hypothetical protein [Idiomarina sp. HP20-50]